MEQQLTDDRRSEKLGPLFHRCLAANLTGVQLRSQQHSMGARRTTCWPSREPDVLTRRFSHHPS
jgi:hypothetical protein